LFALDFETRVILDFHISEYRDSTAAHILLNSCNEQFGKLEMLWLWIATMLIESLLKDSFLTLILSKWKALTTLLTIIPSKPLTVSLRLGTNQKRVKSFDSANLLISLFVFFYNFVRPHSSLNNLAPAQVAGAKYSDKARQKFLLIT